ncbi:MAG: hypothetical protein JNM27_18480 [Leptospirales bacterium]|nr:hypothetical protein [Leptospirales bacterium]
MKRISLFFIFIFSLGSVSAQISSSARTPRNAALKNFLVGQSWECTSVWFNTYLTFHSNNTLRQQITDSVKSFNYEIRDAQVVRKSPTESKILFFVVDAEAPGSMSLSHGGMMTSECRRIANPPPPELSQKVKEERERKDSEEKLRFAKASVSISDVKKQEDSDDCVEFKIKNISEVTFNWLQVTVYFLDKSGKVFSEEDQIVASVSDFASDESDTPLKPNYSRIQKACGGDGFDSKEWGGEVRIEVKKAQVAR